MKKFENPSVEQIVLVSEAITSNTGVGVDPSNNLPSGGDD